MKTEEVKSIKIEFEGNEAEKFKSAIKKIETEVSKIGFGNSLDGDEVKIVRELNDKLNPK